MSANKKEKSQKISMTRKRLIALLTATAVVASFGTSFGAVGLSAEETPQFKTLSYNAELDVDFVNSCTFTTVGDVVTVTLKGPLGDTFEYYVSVDGAIENAGAADSEDSGWVEYTGSADTVLTSDGSTGTKIEDLTASSTVFIRIAAKSNAPDNLVPTASAEITYTAPAAPTEVTVASSLDTELKINSDLATATLTLTIDGEDDNDYMYAVVGTETAPATSEDDWIAYSEPVADIELDKYVFIRVAGSDADKTYTPTAALSYELASQATPTASQATYTVEEDTTLTLNILDTENKAKYEFTTIDTGGVLDAAAASWTSGDSATGLDGIASTKDIYIRLKVVSGKADASAAYKVLEAVAELTTPDAPTASQATYTVVEGEDDAPDTLTLNILDTGNESKYEFVQVTADSDITAYDGAWTLGTGTRTGLDSTKDTYIRVKAVDGVSNASAAYKVLEAAPVAPNAPNADVATLTDTEDEDTLTLTIAENGTNYEYAISSDITTAAEADVAAAADLTWIGYTTDTAPTNIAADANVFVRLKATTEPVALASKSVKIVKAGEKAEAPEITDCSYVKDVTDPAAPTYKLTLKAPGTAKYEYIISATFADAAAADADTTATWTEYTGDSDVEVTEGLGDDKKVFIRIKAADASSLPSKSVEIAMTEIGGGDVPVGGDPTEGYATGASVFDSLPTTAFTTDATKGKILNGTSGIYEFSLGGYQNKYSDYIHLFSSVTIGEDESAVTFSDIKYEWSKNGKSGWQTVDTGWINISDLIAKDKGGADVAKYVYIRQAGDDVTLASGGAKAADNFAIEISWSRDAGPKVLTSLPTATGTTTTDDQSILGVTGVKKDLATAKFTDVMYNPYTDSIFLARPGTTVAKGAKASTYTALDVYEYIFKDATGEVFLRQEVGKLGTDDPADTITGYMEISLSGTNNSFEQAAALKVSRIPLSSDYNPLASASQESKFAYPGKAASPKITFDYATDLFKKSTAKMEYALYNYSDNGTAENTADDILGWIYETGTTNIEWQDVPFSNAGLADLKTNGNESIVKVAFRVKATDKKRASLPVVLNISTKLSDAPVLTYNAATELFVLPADFSTKTMEYRVNKYKAVENTNAETKAAQPAVVADSWAKWAKLPAESKLIKCDELGNPSSTGTRYAISASAFIATKVPEVKIGGTKVAASDFAGYQVQFRFQGKAGATKDVEGTQASAVAYYSINKRADAVKTDVVYDADSNSIKYSDAYLAKFTAEETADTTVTYSVSTDKKATWTVIDKTGETGVPVNPAATIYIRKDATTAPATSGATFSATDLSASAVVTLKTSSPGAAPSVKVDAESNVFTGLTSGKVYEYTAFASASSKASSTAWKATTEFSTGTFTATAATATVADVFGDVTAIKGYSAGAYVHVKFNLQGANAIADTWADGKSKNTSSTAAPTKQTGELVILGTPTATQPDAPNANVATLEDDADNEGKLKLTITESTKSYQYYIGTSATTSTDADADETEGAWKDYTAGTPITAIDSTATVFVRLKATTDPVAPASKSVKIVKADDELTPAATPVDGDATLEVTDTTWKLTITGDEAAGYQYALADSNSAPTEDADWTDYSAAVENIATTKFVFIRVKASETAAASAGKAITVAASE
jgi:hypothetical protein